MSDTVKVKAKVGSDEFEYEGPAASLEAIYKDFLSRLKTPLASTENAKTEGQQDPDESEPEKATRRNGRISRGKRAYPNPAMDTSLNLHGGNDTPSLKKFFDEKNPKGKFEQNAVFGYYLQHLLNLDTFNESHIRACYSHVGVPAPTYFRQSLIDTKNKQGYVDMAANGWKLSVAGENFVRFSLPRKKETPQ